MARCVIRGGTPKRPHSGWQFGRVYEIAFPNSRCDSTQGRNLGTVTNYPSLLWTLGIIHDFQISHDTGPTIFVEASVVLTSCNPIDVGTTLCSDISLYSRPSSGRQICSLTGLCEWALKRRHLMSVACGSDVPFSSQVAAPSVGKYNPGWITLPTVSTSEAKSGTGTSRLIRKRKTK